MFNFFKKKKIGKQIDESVMSFKDLMDTDIVDIWHIVDKNNFVIAMNSWVCKKCNYGEKIGTLSPQERVFFVTQQLATEVNDCGFSQYFYNSSGDFSNEIVSAFVAIGALKIANICRMAIATSNGDIPLNSDEIETVLAKCDNEFYEYADNLTELSYKFVMSNKDHFN